MAPPLPDMWSTRADPIKCVSRERAPGVTLRHEFAFAL